MKKLSLLLVVLFILASCRSQELIRPGDSLEVAYDKAYALYEEERWRDAASAFEVVISIGRGTEYGRNAQFYLAESHYNNRQYLVAASEYERYSASHPNSERRQEADFKAALSYYNLSPRYNIDQQYTRRAIEQFSLFLVRYPNSEMTTEAGQKIDELRDKLARKKYEAAQFYMRTNRYNAAAVYYEMVIDRFPESRYAERSLVNQIDAYIKYAENSVTARQEERFRKAVESYEKYLQLFPRGDNRATAENLYDRAREALLEYEDDEDLTVSGM
jgi:outer membrane protein assembly factor BamD